MVGQASSWLHLDNGFISLWAMWKLCPSSLIHERWNEQESKILPRDILAVRQRGDPAPHSQGWGDSISMSLYCCFLLGGKRFKVATNEPVMIWLLEYEGNFSVISYLELRKGLWLEQNAPGGSLSTFAVFSSTPSLFSRSVFCKCFCIFYDQEAIFVLQFDRRSVAGLDKEPDLIHMEAHMPDGSEYPEHFHRRVIINRISLGINPSLKKRRHSGGTAQVCFCQ